jgi:hypothetical protein
MTFETLMPVLATVGTFAAIGALGAARSDYLSFKASNSPQWLYTYDWGTAVYRWVQGAIVGGVTAAGLELGRLGVNLLR